MPETKESWNVVKRRVRRAIGKKAAEALEEAPDHHWELMYEILERYRLEKTWLSYPRPGSRSSPSLLMAFDIGDGVRVVSTAFMLADSWFHRCSVGRHANTLVFHSKRKCGSPWYVGNIDAFERMLRDFRTSITL